MPSRTPARALLAHPGATAGGALFVALAGPGLFLARSRAEGLFDAALLALLLAFPVRLGVAGLRGLAARWLPLAAGALLGTAAWDLLTALVSGRRAFLSEWPLVYGSGLLAFALVYLVQAMLVAGLIRLRRRATAGGGSEPVAAAGQAGDAPALPGDR